MAPHLLGHHHVRQLVDRGGAEAVLGAERAHQRRPEGHGAQVVDGGIAQVDGAAVGPVCDPEGVEPLGGLVQRLVPGHLLEITAFAPQRPRDAVGIVLQIHQRPGLGADVSLTARIERVASKVHDPLVFEREPEATHGLT